MADSQQQATDKAANNAVDTVSVVDTIAALATAPGRGGVGIIRVSGPQAAPIAEQILGHVPEPRVAEYLAFRCPVGGEAIDNGIALYFPAPNSFTGEHVLELQGHGGPVVMDMLLQQVFALGARPARPGEFSERAFLNEKMDLTQAEAIADLIDSASEQAARLAVRSLQGAFSKRVHQLLEQLTQLRMYVESAIDFPEEEIDFLADDQVSSQTNAVIEALQQTLKSARQGNLLREGIHVVIAGRPNAGKSTLLNRLTGTETAIVTDIPGTTRDVLRAQIHIDGLPLHIIDTAGLRDSADAVEQEGIRRAWGEIKQADRILYLIDSMDKNAAVDENQQHLQQLRKAGPGITLVKTKIDGSDHDAGINDDTAMPAEPIIYLSAKTGEGMDLLTQHLKQCVGYQSVGEGGFMARRRHVEALQRALSSVESGRDQLIQNKAGELLAEDLRQAQEALSEITGEFSSDDLLGKIFSSFCIGK